MLAFDQKVKLSQSSPFTVDSKPVSKAYNSSASNSWKDVVANGKPLVKPYIPVNKAINSLNLENKHQTNKINNCPQINSLKCKNIHRKINANHFSARPNISSKEFLEASMRECGDHTLSNQFRQDKPSEIQSSDKNGSVSKNKKKRKNQNHTKSEVKEVKNNKTVKKYNEPFIGSLDEFMVQEIEKGYSSETSTRPKKKLVSHNHIEKIGKQREFPKPKRLSRLKKMILSERVVFRTRQCQSLPASARSAPVSSGSINDTFISNSEFENSSKEHEEKFHFKCNSINKNCSEQDQLVSDLLKHLATFQDRAYVKSAHSQFLRFRTKRYVCGLREVVKHLKLKRLRMVFIARNLERKATLNFQFKTEGGDNLSVLEEKLLQIWNLANECDPPVPIFITLDRKSLAFLCHKPAPVSVVGIISVSGAEDLGKKLLETKSEINLRCRNIVDNSNPNHLNDIDKITSRIQNCLLKSTPLMNQTMNSSTGES